jgi:hypothetical protein
MSTGDWKAATEFDGFKKLSIRGLVLRLNDWFNIVVTGKEREIL